MKSSTKAVLVIGGGVGAFLLIRALRRRRQGNITFSELQVANGRCTRVDFFKDGTTRSTFVANSQCCADPDFGDPRGPAFAALGCSGGGTSTSTGGLDE